MLERTRSTAARPVERHRVGHEGRLRRPRRAGPLAPGLPERLVARATRSTPCSSTSSSAARPPCSSSTSSGSSSASRARGRGDLDRGPRRSCPRSAPSSPGLTDYKDTSPDSARARRGRAAWPHQHRRHRRLRRSRSAARWAAGTTPASGCCWSRTWSSSVGGYIGGHVVFKYGYMVNFNAFSRGKQAAEFTPVVAGGRGARGHADEGHVRRDRGHARAARRRGPRPQGHAARTPADRCRRAS